MREGGTILKINLTLPNEKTQNIALLHKISESQTTYNKLRQLSMSFVNHKSEVLVK